jgi:hypothetical protein
LIAVSGAMATDNPVDYSFVMMPMGVLIGCSLGAGRAAARESALPIPAPLAAAVEPIMTYSPEPTERPARWGSHNVRSLIDS